MFALYMMVLLLAGVSSARSAAINIIGGSNATQGEFPYQVLIRNSNPTDPLQRPFCGGSLVEVNGTQVVLTSGACVANEEILDLTLVAGELNPYVESGLEQYRNVSVSIYYDSNVDDVAILIPDKPFDLNEQVQPARLPSTLYQNTTGDVVITGWGNMKRYNGQPAEMAVNLQVVEMQLISDQECFDLWSGVVDVQPYHMCTAVSGQEDTCWGDVGGPMYSIEGQYLAGIVGVSPSCSSSLPFPALHIEISHFLDWIEEQVANAGNVGI